MMVSIARVAATINAEQDPEKVLELVCREARALFPADTAVMWEREGPDLHAVRVVGNLDSRLQGLRIPTEDVQAVICRCFRERVAVLENRVVESGIARYHSSHLPPPRSLLCVPLLHREEVLGVLALRHGGSPDRFSQFDLEAASIFADMAAVAMANARLREATGRHAREAAALSKIGRILSSGRDVVETSEAFAHELRHLVAFDRVTIALLEGDQHFRRFLAAGVNWEGFGAGTVSPLAGSGVGWVLEQGRTLVISDLRREQLFPADQLFASRDMRSVVRVPLMQGGEVLGTLNLFSTAPGSYGRRQTELLEQVAGQIAGVIANAQMVESQRLLLSRLYSLQRVTDAALSTLDLDSLLDSLLERSMEIVGAESGAILLLNEAGTELSVRGTTGMAGDGSRSCGERLGEGISGRMALDGKPRLIVETEAEDPGEVAWALAGGIHSMLAVPLKARGRIIGVFRLESRQPARFRQQQLRLMEVAAERMALAIDNARLMQEARERAAHESLIHRIASAIGSSLDFDRVMNTAVGELLHAMGCSRCIVSLANPDDEFARARWEARAEGIPTSLDRRIPWRENAHVRAVTSSTDPLAIEDVESEHWPEGVRSLAADLGVRSALSAALFRGEQAIGILHLQQCDRARRWTNGEVELVRAVAAQLAVAAENARLYEETDEKLRARVQEIQSQKARTEALLSSMSEGMYAIDRNLRMTAVNPALEALLGRRADEMVGRSCREVLQPADEEGEFLLCDEDCPARVVLEEGRAIERAVVFTRTAWGDRLPTAISMAPIRDESGRVEGLVAVLRDVTREWQVDKLKSNIISVVSHEFRSPLTSIIGFSELLLMHEQSEEERRHCLEHMLKDGLRLEALVNDFLDASRLESGKVVLNPEPVDPAAAVERSIASIATAGGAGRHRLESKIEKGLPPVEADPERIAQILDNLLSNALKYSTEGTTVTIRARSASSHGDGRLRFGGDGPDGWVVFVVEDRGIGIPADQLSDIFTPFHRVEGHSTRRIRGTGLGLSIVKSLVELHRGRVWVESEIGVGSRFHVALRAISHDRGSGVGG